MSSVFKLFSFFFLLLLCMNENLAREIAKEAKSNQPDAYDGNHGCHKEMHQQHIHAHTSSYMDHMDPSLRMFFHKEDLKARQKMPLYFPIKDPSTIPHMIPKQEADSIPFSMAGLHQILDFFSFSQGSSQAKAIKQTLMHCEIPATKGESKFCATSLESMLENLANIFGSSNKFKVLTTTHLKNWRPHLQNYTIMEDPKEIRVAKMVGCHPMPYPYAVFYCHGQESDNKLFVISLEGENDGVRFEAVGICHMDTSQWDPSHASFRVLGIQPGTSPVCHVFPQDNLVWVSSSISSSSVHQQKG